MRICLNGERILASMCLRNDHDISFILQSLPSASHARHVTIFIRKVHKTKAQTVVSL